MFLEQRDKNTVKKMRMLDAARMLDEAGMYSYSYVQVHFKKLFASLKVPFWKVGGRWWVDQEQIESVVRGEYYDV